MAKNISILQDVLVTKRTFVKTSISAANSVSLHWNHVFLFMNEFDEFLKQQNAKNVFEHSFIKFSLRLSIYIYGKVQGANKEKMRKYMKKTFFPKYKFYYQDRSFYDSRADYETMLQIVSLSKVKNTSSLQSAINKFL